MRADILVIGAGMVGAAIGYGLASQGRSVIVLDGGDHDHRAAYANFGLVWLQGKGWNKPAYQHLTLASIRAWPDFSGELADLTGVDMEYEGRGGLVFCVGEDDFEQRRARLRHLSEQRGGAGDDFEMLDRHEIERMFPRIRFGQEVVGASFGRHDGHANPMRLLLALQQGLVLRGGQLLRRHEVTRIAPAASGYVVHAGGRTFSADRIVLAAGLNNAALAPELGLDVPVRPQRGQILVTERLAPLMAYPGHDLRQTRDGTLLIGSTIEEAGFDSRATARSAARLSADATKVVPSLASVRVVRQWSGLRVMTPDGFPVYTESAECPGVFLATCHSGVTLAAFHAATLAPAISAGALPAELSPFREGRFGVSQAA